VDNFSIYVEDRIGSEKIAQLPKSEFGIYLSFS
jgi:hypothetical protein